jgi:predicted  nucleic acid-binding Zn-ribbon protein
LAAAAASVQQRLEKAQRQAGKMSIKLAEMESKFVDNKVQMVNLIDQVNTLEEENRQLRGNSQYLSQSVEQLHIRVDHLSTELKLARRK